MPEMVKITFVTTFALSLLNFFIYFLLNKFWKKPQLEQMTHYWLSIILLFFVQIPIQNSPLIIALVFSLNLIPAMIICRIFLESFGKTLHITKYLTTQVFAIAISLYLHDQGYSFTLYSAPVAAAACFPVFDSLYHLYNKRIQSTPAHWILAFTLVYSLGTVINFCVNRLTTDPTTLWWGWITASFNYILSSSLVPFFILQDIFSQEEKKLNDTIDERTKDLTTLNSILSHDISNALQVIDLSVYRAMKSSDNEFLEKTQKKVHETLSLLKFVKTYFKNKDRTEPIEQIFLENTLIQVVDDYRELAAQKNIKIKVVSELPTGSSLLIDSNLFKTCLIGNVIKNSIKFSHEGEIIEVRALKDIENKISIVIKDTGIGMNEEQLKQVFTKSGKSTFGTRGEIGTGLGLPIVKELMENHGGQVSIASKVNTGTTVTLTF